MDTDAAAPARPAPAGLSTMQVRRLLSAFPLQLEVPTAFPEAQIICIFRGCCIGLWWDGAGA